MTPSSLDPDAIVAGSGPNGLAAAIELARSGHSVQVREAETTIGGGVRSAETTLPGFVHDFGSAIHPLGVASPFMRSLDLEAHGLQWVHPLAPLAHPLDDGSAAVLERSIRATGETLGPDARAYRRLMEPLVAHWDAIVDDVLAPPRPPRHPLVMARLGLYGMRSARGLAESLFQGEHAQALFGGMGAHSFLPLEQTPSAGFGLMLAVLGHAVGWPFPRGGAQCLTDALAHHLRSLGGEIVTGERVESMDQLSGARAVLFDVTPRQLVHIAGSRLPRGYRRKLEGYRYGPGVCKVDFALDGPIPWTAAECLRAGTVHLGGTLAEIAQAEREVAAGGHPEKPFVLLAQQSLFDSTRAPAGKHTVWAYCHVPNGSTVDMTDRIERQIERFAPGFRDRILAKHTSSPADLQRQDANLVGGDINGGIQDWRQFYTRPSLRIVPYSTPARDLYICSSSTPPGGGVHGMCGYYAARAALRRSLQ